MGNSITCCVAGDPNSHLPAGAAKMEVLGLQDLEDDRINPWSGRVMAEPDLVRVRPKASSRARVSVAECLPKNDAGSHCFRQSDCATLCEGEKSGPQRMRRMNSEGGIDLRDHLSVTGVSSLGLPRHGVRRRGRHALDVEAKPRIYGHADSSGHDTQIELVDDDSNPRPVTEMTPEQAERN